MTDLYHILGVSRHASEREIKAAYRRLAKLYHPDVNPSPTAAEDFLRITNAYRILSNKRLRAMYDRGQPYDYEEYLRRQEQMSAIKQRIEAIIEELLRQEREEIAVRQIAVMIAVTLFASGFLVALTRPLFFETLGLAGRITCVILFVFGIWELVKDVTVCLEHYTSPDDVTPSIIETEEKPEKPFTRAAVLAFLIGGYFASVALGSLVRYLLEESNGQLLLSRGIFSVILSPPIAVLIIMRLRALSERLEIRRQ